MKLDEITGTESPFTGKSEKGGLFNLGSWFEQTGGWIKFLGTGAIGLFVVDLVVRAFHGGGGGLLSMAQSTLNGLGLTAAPAAAAPAKSAAGPTFFV